MDISIIVCCYNSEKRIESTLKAISLQETKLKWEVLIIDNNSTDCTVEVATNYWKKLNLENSLIILTEKEPGLSNARECGIINSNGELIIFCDDDNHLDSDYLQNAYNIMASDNKLGALCGKNTPKYMGSKDPIINSFIEAYACGELHSESTYLKGKSSPWGAGLVVRSKFMKTLYEELNFKSILSDRKGNALSSGGDTEFCYLLKLAGYTWRYDTSLHLDHELPSNRLTYNYLKKLRFAQGKALVSIDWYYKFGHSERFKIKNSSWLKIFISQLFRLFTHKLSLPISRKKHLENLYQIGYITQLWKERKNFRYNELYVKNIIEKILGKKKTTIAIDTVFFNKPYSGISVVWKTILDNLYFDKYDLVLLKRKNSIIPSKILKKYKVIEIESFDYVNMKKDVDYLNNICKINFIDFFISTYYTYTTIIPCIVYIHDTIPEIFNWDFTYSMWRQKKLCIENGTHFIAISKNTLTDFKKFYSHKTEPFLVYNALDTKRLSVKDINIIKKINIQKPFFLLTPTNKEEYKNIILIKRLFDNYPEIFNDFDFVVLSDVLNKYPVKTLNSVSEKELTTLISETKAIIYPSLYEGFGLPILEGFYLETFVLACKNSAVKEIGQDGCIYISPTDEVDLKNNLYKIIDGFYNEKLKIGKKIAKKYSVKKQINSLNQVFNQIISQ